MSDDLDAAWDQLQQEQHRQQEEAAIARARVAGRELERILIELKQYRKPTNDRHQRNDL